MVRTTTQNYEVSSESGRERHVRIPYARLLDNTPALHDPAAVTSLLVGVGLTGTVVTLDAVGAIAIINIADGAVYWHNVRNVLTYNIGAENTWGPINVGDPIYYDNSATMPANTWLSTAPANNVAGANVLFGFAGLGRGETAASFPKGGIVASTQECAVIQQ
jgi:hypothetical protein